MSDAWFHQWIMGLRILLFLVDAVVTLLLRYDGRWDWVEGENRQWTIVSHFVDANGHDRYKGSFGLDSILRFAKGAA